MSTNFGFIAHATQAHAHKLAAGSTRNRLAERGFADARRSDKAKNRRFEPVDALLHGQIFDDPFLDLF